MNKYWVAMAIVCGIVAGIFVYSGLSGLIEAQNERIDEFFEYVDGLEVGQSIDADHQWIRVKSRGADYDIYVAQMEYNGAESARIKVKDGIIVNITYRIAR